MRPDFLKAGIIIRGIVLGILFLPNLLWADTNIGKAVVKQFNSAFTVGSSRSDTNPTPIPWSELGAQASMQSQGRGTSIQASKSGAFLESMFQRLAGEVGEHGMQLWSTVKDDPQTRFSVLATGLGRRKGNVAALEGSGRVEVEKDLIRFVRSGVVEEYTVSVDGVRQDFVIAEPPPGNGDLRVELSIAGATAQPSDRGATLILQDSRRQLSYHRLRVLDARNRQLPARIVVESPRTLAVMVADANAVYPIRIDPTFSDADWHGMGFSYGPGEQIHAVAVMEGDVYVGGSFTEGYYAPANYLAKWSGSSWSKVLGINEGGVDYIVMGLLVDGSDLYACGHFTVADGVTVNHIAKWYLDGSERKWSALGSGTNDLVNAMAMDGGNLYVGGTFTKTGDDSITVNRVAKWNGSAWSPLVDGVNDTVDALAVDANHNLYAGGYFTTAGGAPANRVAKWDGSAWSALGDGVNNTVKVLAVDPSDNLYAGGLFSAIGDDSFNRIAKWEGGTWNHLGTGVTGQGVYALAIDDVGNLYAGGEFTAAGGVPANNIARWDGSSWSALGSGVDDYVNALAASGDKLYVVGMFTVAGDDESALHVAYADNLPIAPGTYYVDIAYGNNANNGTSAANAWKTLHYAIDQINGGSTGSYTLNVAPGSFSIWYMVGDGLESDTELTVSQNNVTIIGQTGSTVIIDGDGAETWLKGLEITGSNVTIKNLHITNFSYGIKIDSTSPDNEISQNKIYDNEFNIGINGGSPYINNNLIYESISGSVSFGISIGGTGTVEPRIYHNTIDGGLSDGIYIADSGNAPEIKYNIITNFNQYGIQNVGGNPTIDYNDVWHNGPEEPYVRNYDGCDPGTHDISKDPLYVAASTYNLQTCSPCIDTIGSGDPVIIDINDISRPQGPAKDMGAYEYQYQMPAVTNFSPTSGTTGTTVTIEGSYFCGASGVSFGSMAASSFTVNSDTQITAIVGTGSTGNVSVTNPGGTGTSSGTTFTYESPPTVNTAAVSSITTTTASSGGNVTSDGGAEVTERGVCWSTSANPTINDSKTTDGTGTGTFTSGITGLSPNTAYHVRAYATNSENVTGYGSDKTFTTAAPAGTYYVDIVNGDDSNDGSAAHPWKTLHHAFTQINGGGAGTYVLYVALGTYSVAHEGDTQMILSQSQVTIKGEQGSAPIINGTDAQNWTRGLEITGSDVTIENLYVTGFSDTNEEGIRISGGTGNEIRYCKIYGNNWGIRVYEADTTTIRNCDIYENTTHGIDDVLSTDTSVVRNSVHDNLLYAIRTQSSSEISRNLIYDNTFGILVELINGSSASPTIKNNVIYEVASGTMSYGIYIRAQNASNLNPFIYHNTIDGGVLTGIYLDEDGTNPSAPIIKYNIITEFGQYGIQNSGANPTIQYNDVWNNTAGNYSGIEVIPSTNISADPLYGSYSLQADSPCINTIPSGEGDPVTLDYPGYNRPRPGKETKDMGAYEYVADETSNYTLPGGTGLSTDYRIFTVPLNLGTGLDMLTAMEDVLGSYNPVHWRAFLYNGTSHIEFNTSQFASQAIVPGMGFWIITTYTSTIPFEGAPAPDGVDYVMDLDPGWHLIGLPWLDTSILLSSIKVTDGVYTHAISSADNNLTQRFLWDYTGDGPDNGYTKRSAVGFRLQNNKGYFFKVGDEPIRMIIPNAADVPPTPPADIAPNQTNTNEDDEAPPPPPGAEPIPDIKANGQDGPVTVNAGDPVSVSVSLDPGAWSGRNADWWVAARTPFETPWYTYTYDAYPQGWRSGIQVCVQLPLFELIEPFSVLNMVLPVGDYTFYFAVDGNMDGNPDATWMDSVEVTVE